MKDCIGNTIKVSDIVKTNLGIAKILAIRDEWEAISIEYLCEPERKTCCFPNKVTVLPPNEAMLAILEGR